MKILVTMLVMMIAHGQTSLSGASQPCKALPWRTWLLGFVQARERGEAPRRPGIEREICPESWFFFYFCAKDKQEVSRYLGFIGLVIQRCKKRFDLKRRCEFGPERLAPKNM